MRRGVLFGLVLTGLLMPSMGAGASPEEHLRTIVVSFSNATLQVLAGGRAIFETRVVLPRPENRRYELPVTGIVTESTMDPWWYPTSAARRQNDSLKEAYEPGDPGNEMGDCKIYIDWGGVPFMEYIRIHGNGAYDDLGKRLSSGCIRTPDALCRILVALSTKGTEVIFRW